MKASFLVLFLLCLFHISCKEEDSENEKLLDSSRIWFDYRVWGDEEGGYMTIKAQYRLGGPNGKAISLAPPANVMLDGSKLLPDSSRMTGVYYEISRPTHEFEGPHEIVFTDYSNKQYKQPFRFQPLTLLTEIPEIFSVNRLQLELEGVSQNERVRLIMMDTASFSEGIDRLDSVKHGTLIVDSLEFATLAPGPIFLELTREKEQKILNGNKQRGRFSMSYGIKRQFEKAARSQ